VARITKPVVSEVSAGSAAARAGLKPGDKVMAINGKPVRDDLDFRFLSADESLELHVINQTGDSTTLQVCKGIDEPLGVEFGGKATFDGIYTCHNNCVFCFVHQQPRGLRTSLNLMDDDFRLSYMHGNFITLVGISEENWSRIFEQKLSPLYISVHATDDDLRAFLLGTEKGRGIMDQLRQLADGGLQFHTQVVACPGLNDGHHLDQTIRDLISLGPDALLSISVVPVGLTKYRKGLYELRPYTGEESATVIDQIEGWQRRLHPEWGHVVAYASDEWYVSAGREVPPAEVYGTYDQFENGVGMIRLFLEQMRENTYRLPESLTSPRKVTVVTGVLGQEALNRAALWLTTSVRDLDVKVVVIENEFYGPSTTVAGLLMAQDMIARLTQEKELGDLVILPSVAFRATDVKSLDNLTPTQISEAIGTPVELAWTPVELAQTATGGLLAPERRRRVNRLRFRHQGEAATVNHPKESFNDPLAR